MTTPPARVEDRVPDAAAPLERGTHTALDSSELLQHRQEVVIRHEGALYRLRRTRSGGLILTK